MMLKAYGASLLPWLRAIGGEKQELNLMSLAYETNE